MYSDQVHLAHPVRPVRRERQEWKRQGHRGHLDLQDHRGHPVHQEYPEAHEDRAAGIRSCSTGLAHQAGSPDRVVASWGEEDRAFR